MSRHLLAAGDLSRTEATAILDDADRFAQALVGREVRKLPYFDFQEVATARRQAMSIAVLAQLYVANANYQEALRQFKTNHRLVGRDTL